jgi:glutamyl-tRNA synthetase
MATLPTFRTRIAPTPSGYLHLGNAYNFLLVHRWAQVMSANRAATSIRLRIDDLDQERVRPEYLRHTFDLLAALEIPIDLGPKDVADHLSHYSQRDRLSAYQLLLDKAMDQELVYACRCSRRTVAALVNEQGITNQTLPTDSIHCPCVGLQLHPDHEDNCLRLMPTKWDQVLQAMAQQQQKSTPSEDISDPITAPGDDISAMPPVLRRRDKLPAYHITTLVDDETHQITHIVRGQDLWPSTILQQYLATWLNLPHFSKIHFWHHGLIRNEAGEKLSKSAGANKTPWLPSSNELKWLREQALDCHFDAQ